MSDERYQVNGVNGLTGEYLVAPFDESNAATWAREASMDAELDLELSRLWKAASTETLGVPFYVRPEDPGSAGWAVVFSTAEAPEVKTALEPLIEHRRRRSGDKLTKVLEHRPGERWPEWLDRHGTAPGNVVPEKVPYYVLLVGDPDLIPFSFQYLLDVEYAVGRLAFDDADGYRRYITALIEQEEGQAPPRDAALSFFGTRHPSDQSTALSSDWLVTPLADDFGPGGDLADRVPPHRVDISLGDSATKAAFAELLAGTGGAGRPSVLFSATHGLGGWPPRHPDQATHHGALVCQDWPGLGRIDATHYFAAADLDADASVHGMVAFFFACFGAGTPELDPFTRTAGQPPERIAEKPFVAQLPKALLSHPEGGALAVIGHVERAWGFSFTSRRDAQLIPFQNALGRILRGEPIGHAMKDFNERYASLSTNLTDVIDEIAGGRRIPDAEVARLWIERNDAQNYVVLGDPAVALRPG